MRELILGRTLRALLGIVGAVAVLAGLLVDATELRIATRWWPYWPALVATAVCGAAALGGAALVRGAMRGAARGRIAVRRPAGSPQPPGR